MKMVQVESAVMELPVLGAAEPYLIAELDKGKHRIVQRALNSSTDGILTPDLALQLWAEYIAVERLHRGMVTRRKLAAAEATRFPG